MVKVHIPIRTHIRDQVITIHLVPIMEDLIQILIMDQDRIILVVSLEASLEAD